MIAHCPFLAKIKGFSASRIGFFPCSAKQEIKLTWPSNYTFWTDSTACLLSESLIKKHRNPRRIKLYVNFVQNSRKWQICIEILIDARYKGLYVNFVQNRRRQQIYIETLLEESYKSLYVNLVQNSIKWQICIENLIDSRYKGLHVNFVRNSRK